jgi:uncharacterized protein DUF4304
MSIVAKQIDEIVRLGLGPLMKANGFAKSGRDFHRRKDDNWQVVNVQASQGNFGETGKFTINFGVYLPAISLLAGGPLQRVKPKEYECTVRQRAGLLTGKIDQWWEVSPLIPVVRTAEEVATAVEQFGLPWLEVHSHVPAVAEALRRQPSVMAAAAALAAGDAGEAKRRLHFMAVDRPMAAATARAWATEHGLDDGWPEPMPS